MKALGWSLVVLGLMVVVGSLMMPTTAPLDVPSTTIYGLPTRSDVYNLGLLQQQMMVFVVGCALSALGGALAGIGQLQDRLFPPRPTDSTAPGAARSLTAAPSDDDPAASVDDVAGSANSEIGWVVGVGVVAILIAIFALAAGSMSSPSASSSTNITDMNVADETAVDNMTAVDAGALKDPVPSTAPKISATPESTPLDDADDGEFGRDNWQGE
jgi:tetrahydromethanopterin S-methyltransferase subunit B